MSAMSQQLQSDFRVAGTSDPLQHRPPLPKLDILAVDADEEPHEEWEAEDDVKGGPLDPREVKNDREREIMYLWDMEVYEYSTEAEARARTRRNPVGLKWIDTNKGSAEAPRYRSRLVCFGGAPQRRGIDLLGNTSAGNPSSPAQCCASGKRFSSGGPFPDHHRGCESSTLLR